MEKPKASAPPSAMTAALPGSVAAAKREATTGKDGAARQVTAASEQDKANPDLRRAWLLNGSSCISEGLTPSDSSKIHNVLTGTSSAEAARLQASSPAEACIAGDEARRPLLALGTADLAPSCLHFFLPAKPGWLGGLVASRGVFGADFASNGPTLSVTAALAGPSDFNAGATTCLHKRPEDVDGRSLLALSLCSKSSAVENELRRMGPCGFGQLKRWRNCFR